MKNRQRKSGGCIRGMVRLVAIGIVLVAVSIGVCNWIVIRSAKGRTYSEINAVPYHKVGVVLGTVPYLANGHENYYFNSRMKAAADLYFAHKISYILATGDNHKRNYNEPESMRQALLALGVPDSAIILDYAGFRTFDSMVRAKKVFGQDSFIVISQHWHNERAIFIALHQGMDVVGYDAKDAIVRRGYVKNCVREMLAKVKAVYDVCVGKQPKYLGEPVIIPFAVETQTCILKHVNFYDLDEFDMAITIDIPINTPKELADSITAFLNERLYQYFDNGEDIHLPYESVYTSNLQHLANHYWSAYRSFYDEKDPEFDWLDLNLVAQTDSYVTYEAVKAFRGEGIHEFREWVTFVMEDGHRLKEAISFEDMKRLCEDLPELMDSDILCDAQYRQAEGYSVMYEVGLLKDSLAFMYVWGNTGHDDVYKYDMRIVKPYLSKEAQKLVRVVPD